MPALQVSATPAPKSASWQQPGNVHNVRQANKHYVLGTAQVGAVVPVSFVCFCTAGNAQSGIFKFKQGTYCTTEAKPNLKCCTV